MKLYVLNMYWLYMGFILGVSFLATPIKFKAPGLTLPVALEIGQATFHFFNKVEWGFVLFFLGSAMFLRVPWIFVVAIVLLVILCVDTFGLLPKLDHRIALIAQGQKPTPSMLHKYYVALEISKVMIIACAAFYLQRRLV
ncbi:MAG: hypothetical protein KDD46_03540 [Bdellovibrionales bacterium]|nr:hypothetical protein [Bdellovibrionales bacterium]